MAKKLIHYDQSAAGKLHCDACGYDAPHKSAFTPELIGTPCPQCGADMLSKADYEATAKLFSFVDGLNRWFGWLGKEYMPETKSEFETLNVTIHNDEMKIKRGK